MTGLFAVTKMRTGFLSLFCLSMLACIPASLAAYGPSAEGPTGRSIHAPQPSTYTQEEITQTGDEFFNGTTEGFAKAVEYVFSKFGRPVGYIQGEEGSAAFLAGLRYGEGVLNIKSDDQTHPVFWQGPSFGFDVGGNGSKTMVLVYNLQDVEQLYRRFGGMEGSAYFIGGFGVNFQVYEDIVLAPIRTGLGFRLGVNAGYLKYTEEPTWNPF